MFYVNVEPSINIIYAVRCLAVADGSLHVVHDESSAFLFVCKRHYNMFHGITAEIQVKDEAKYPNANKYKTKCPFKY